MVIFTKIYLVFLNVFVTFSGFDIILRLSTVVDTKITFLKLFYIGGGS